MARVTCLTQLQDAALKKFVDAEVACLKRQMEALLQQMTTLTMEILKRNSTYSPDGSTLGLQNRDGGNNSGGEVQISPVRLDFPVFHGEDPMDWLYKVKQFFYFHNTSPQHRIWLASFHIEDQALTFSFKTRKSQPTDCDSLIKSLLLRFGPNAYDNPIEALTRLSACLELS